MTHINYKTEGKALVKAQDGTDTVAVTWEVDDGAVFLHQGGNTIMVAQDQAIQLSPLLDRIAKQDLGPDFSHRVKEA